MTREERYDSFQTPAEIDEAIVQLAARQGALDEEIGRALLRAFNAKLHRHFGMASFAEYVGRRFGYSPRVAKDKAAVAEALANLPRLRAALIEGARPWSAIRELVRVASSRTEAEWLRVSEAKTVREVERLVSGLRPGDLPSAEKDPLLTIHRTVFNQTSDQHATTREAITRARRILGPTATDGECLNFLSESFLGRAKAIDEEPGYQVVVTICADCGVTHRPVAGELIEVSPATRDCALCDGEIVGLAPTALDPGPTSLDPEPTAPTHVGQTSAHVGRSDAELTEIFGDLIKTRGLSAVYRVAAKAIGFSLKTIPPSLRKAVLARDNFRCTVPGCRDHLFIDLHHLQHVEDGGPNHPENLTTLCFGHHHLHHDGYLAIEGTPSTGLIFRTSRGTLYGTIPKRAAA